jgi:predicted nucleic acid-binding protein
MNDNDILLLDTNAILYLINGDEKVLRLIDDQIIAVNFIVEIELLSWPLLTPKIKGLLKAIIKEARYYDYSHNLKEQTISLRQEFNLKLGDAFIAATAINFDLTLISADKVFSKVPSVKFVNFAPTRLVR